MRKQLVAAVCGKGGVGKTTVCAVAARELARAGSIKALLVDADPAGGLFTALGLDAARTLNDVRKDTIRDVQARAADKKDLAMSVDFRIMEALQERGNLAFLSIGRPEELGCYCAVNTLLREAIELLSKGFDLTIIDAEAGIEQVNRNVLSRVDTLVLVSDSSVKGIRVAEQIADVAREVIGQAQPHLLMNRVGASADINELKNRSRLDLLGWVPEDETIKRFDELALPYFDLPDCPASQAILAALAKAGIDTSK